ncbi:hypothetical protein [Parvularcula sp. LCG005]|uniref:hypothetical protein n=1 Tax=Parvularcula sp. LCG005 TaxID=3078805 RepID=UPI0029420947|nr:hypothetical protein [Parvularcula sp. LCG005]WOI53774.1 hypothetical protein RUI03_01950 [Parvularcula sp. LCG005]
MNVRYHLVAVSTVLSALFGVTGAASAADELQITQGGYAEVAIPRLARGITIRLEDIVDTSGPDATFRVQIYEGKVQTGYRRVTLSETDGYVTLYNQRAFDRVRIVDDEGTVSARLTGLSLCWSKPINFDYCEHARWNSMPARFEIGTKTQYIYAGGYDASKYGGETAGYTEFLKGIAPEVEAVEVAEEQQAPTSGRGELPMTMPSQEVEVPVVEASTAGRGPGTPITRMDHVAVQAGVVLPGGYTATDPWIDHFKISKNWTFNNGNQVLLKASEIEMNENGMPVQTADMRYDWNHFLVAGYLWDGLRISGSDDAKGTWRMWTDGSSELHPWNNNIEFIKKTPYLLEFRCVERCVLMFRVSNVKDGATPPHLVQLTDADGRAVNDIRDLENGLLTRERWRRAMYGYEELRWLSESGANSPGMPIIRYDRFAKMPNASWNSSGNVVPNRLDEKQVASEPQANIRTGMGSKYTSSPVEARLRAAWEIGAVYHHNLPPQFTNSKEDIAPEVFGQWAVDLWNDPSYTEAERRSVLNDYELQHVDEFGADIVRNQKYVVNNQVKVEVGNETWNYAFSYNIGLRYMQRLAEHTAKMMGREADWKGSKPENIQTGYELTKAIARLRYKYPDIEWRGVMAVHTGSASDYRFHGNPPPETPSGLVNLSLHGMMDGYNLFWEDVANHPELAEMYAAKPEKPGDWFEVQGTTYYSVESMLADGKTHIAGIPPTELAARVADRSQWPALRAEILDFFINSPATPGEASDPKGRTAATASLPRIKQLFVALAEHAAVYGMQVGSYEGGNHSSIGTYFYYMKERPPGLMEFWRDFSDSVELGLIQTAVHDAAVEAGWMRLADFDLFNGATKEYIFATRKSFEDITGRYCEYVRWMPQNPTKPRGLEDAADLEKPQERCGGMVEYLNGAKANNYYAGQKVPDLSAFSR